AVGGDRGEAGSLVLLEADTGRPRPFPEDRFDHPVTSLAFTRDGERLLIGDRGGIHPFDIASGRERMPIPLPPDPNRSLVNIAVAPDARFLAVTDFDNILLFNLERRQRPEDLRGHRQAVRAVAFLPEVPRLASVSLDGTVRLW